MDETRWPAAGLACFMCSLVLLAGCFELNDEEPKSDDSDSAGRQVGNAPPTIAGNPAPAVNVGDVYSFLPSASDPDGDDLSFTIENLPHWLSFDARTGRLSGKAMAGTEAIYDDVSISVSDGTHSISLMPFSIEVTQVAMGSVTLSWTPPVENTDGSPLENLAGYRIYYGTAQGLYSHSILIDNPGIATYMVGNLVPHTYYFAATSINAAGAESSLSNVATIVVDSPN